MPDQVQSASTIAQTQNASVTAHEPNIRGFDLIEMLYKEAENLKKKLELERQRLNDITMEQGSSQLEHFSPMNIKQRRILKGHSGKVLCMDWSFDRRRIVSSAQDGKVIVWDAFTTNKEHAVTLATTWVMACAFAPGADMIACGGLDNKCSVVPLSFDEDILQKRRPVATHTSYTSCCAFMRSDNHLLTGSGDSTCALWDTETGQMLENFHGHKGDVFSVDVHRWDAGNIFVSAGADRHVLVWDIRNGSCVQRFGDHEADVNCVRFTPSGDGFATGSDDSTCRLFDLRADRQVCSYEYDCNFFPITGVDFSYCGRLLFVGCGDYRVGVWDAFKCHRQCAIYGHENRISWLRSNPDGSSICTASWDCTLRIWA